jgi:hypothetical protein
MRIQALRRVLASPIALDNSCARVGFRSIPGDGSNDRFQPLSEDRTWITMGPERRRCIFTVERPWLVG